MDSKVKYGQELGVNLIKIAKRLMGNQNLCKLLVNTDLTPLNSQVHPDEIKGTSLLHNNIKVVPYVDSANQTEQSIVVLLFDEGTISAYNPDNENIVLVINVFTPFNTWAIEGDTLRPFAIMSEIRKSLQDRRINGLGEIRYESFQLSSLTEQMGIYTMRFVINAFS